VTLPSRGAEAEMDRTDDWDVGWPVGEFVMEPRETLGPGGADELEGEFGTDRDGRFAS